MKLTTLPRMLKGLAAVMLICQFLLPSASVSAATPDSLYSYDFTNGTITSPVTNGANANSGVNLNLYGNWSQSTFGVHFTGDLVSQQSVGYTKPASGNTISVPSTQAIGAGIKFKYQGPTSGNCLGDSRNLTQIGRSGAGLSQIKLQLSNCGTDSAHVFPECRMAGANSSTADIPMTGTQALVDGNTYIVKCFKAPDPVSGQAVMTLRTVRVDTTNGNDVTSDNFNITATGLLQSSAYLSVANKYALPAQIDNTDQFVGDVAKVAYCSGATLTDATTCINTELAEPLFQEFVGNQSIETDITGWTGKYNTTSVNSQGAGGYDGSYSLRSVNNTLSTGSNGFIDKPIWMDGTSGKGTVTGNVYTGDIWLKADTAGQVFNVYLRERNASNVTVGSKTVTVTAATTGWTHLTNAYTAVGTGNSLTFYVYATNVAAGAGFNADMMSLKGVAN
jgi:hypothetical protein